MQDFMRLYQAKLLLHAQMVAEGETAPKLTAWLHEYCVRSFKDKVMASQSSAQDVERLGV